MVKVTDEIVLESILGHCKNVEELIAKFPNKEDILKERMYKDVLCYHVLLIGEQSQDFTQAFIEAHKEVDWDKIKGIHDRIYNEDVDIIFDEVWNIAVNEIPRFFKSILK